MPNYCSNHLSTTNPAIIAELQAAVRDGKIKNLLGLFLPVPQPLQGLMTGGTIIDGEPVQVWRRDADGTDTAIPADTLAAWRAEYGADNWYDWSVANWGTKWDTDAELELHNGRAVLWFSTAWAPPLAWLDKLVQAHPDGETLIAYAEGGNGFYGTTRYNDGYPMEVWEADDYYDPSKEWDDDTDPLDMLSPRAAAHHEEYGVI